MESRGCPPSGRYAHATATFDQGNSRMLVFGGADGKGGRMADWYTVVSRQDGSMALITVSVTTTCIHAVHM